MNLMVINEELLSYSKMFKNAHSLNFLAGFSYQYDQTEYNMGSAKNAPSDKIHYAPSGMPELGESGYGDYTETIAFQHYQSDMYEKILLSYFARIEYDYKNKYLFSFCFRGDGSSTFGRGNKWGTFPAVAVGWSFSEENWVKENLGWLSFGKMRASWGKSGKTFEQPYTAAGILQNGKTSFLNGAILEPVWFDGLYNEDLTWEETAQYDFGIDMDLLDYRLGLTLDYYYRYTDKLLYPVTIDQSINSYERQWRNAAAISNEGLELLVRYEIFRQEELYWKVSVNGAKNWNRFEESYDGKDMGGRIIGKPLNGIYTFQSIGLINSAEDVPFVFDDEGVKKYLYIEANGATGFLKPGDYMLTDIDGDGVISFSDDRVYTGSALPEFYGGLVSEFQWKDLDVNLSLTYQIGKHVVNALQLSSLYTDAANQNHPIFVDLRKVSFWESSEDNDVDYPANKLNNEFFRNYTSLNVEKVNWLKLKTLSIGYSLPRRWLRCLGMNYLRVFVSGENLLTFSNYSGVEPETVMLDSGGDSGQNYPLARRYTVGLTIKF